MTPEEVRVLIRKVIAESELPKAVLARDSELSYAALNSWIVGARDPRPESVKQLADGLRARAARLVELAEDLDKAA